MRRALISFVLLVISCRSGEPASAPARDAETGGIRLDAGVVREDATAIPPDSGVSIDDAAYPPADATTPRLDATAPDSAPDATPAPPPYDGGDVHAGGGLHPAEDCTRYPYSSEALLAELEGFGQHTTGGDPSRVYHVTSLAADGPGTLREALESNEPYWIVFDIEGVITLLDERIEATSNKTVDGRGRDITVRGSIRIRDDVNLIFTDFKMENDLQGHCTQSGDVLPIGGPRGPTGADYATRDIWLNHMEIFNGGDGLVDLRGATDVTVSWTHFHTHKKGLLWSDPDDGLTGGGQHATIHHSYFDRISLRGPQAIGGWLHFFNNYQFQWYEYGAGGLGGAQFLSENNIYEARPGNFCFVESRCRDPNPCGDFDIQVSKKGLVYNWTEGNGDGFVKSSGDWALEDAVLTENQPARVTFDPRAHYAYTLEPADQTSRMRIVAGAGPRADYCR